MLRDLLKREFIFVTGKGGVGKSTVSAVLALEAARYGRRVLIVVPEGFQPHDALWGKDIPAEPGPVAPGVHATLAEAESAMRQYSEQVLKSRRLVDLLFHSKVARGFLTGIPGLSDWAILGKAWAYTRSSNFQLPPGEEPYDLVILDAPASGDGTKMLRIPEIIADMGAAGQIRKDADRCRKMLHDPARTALVLVTLTEELVVQETEENLLFLRQGLGLPMGPVFVNQIQPELFEAAELALVAKSTMPSQAESAELLSLAKRYAARQNRQRVHLARLDDWDLPVVQLPKITAELVGLQALHELQLALAPGSPGSYRESADGTRAP